MSHLQVSSFRAAVMAGVAAALLLGWSPLPAAASPAPAAKPATTYGGSTGQGFPIIVDVNGSKTRVARVLTAVRMTCRPTGNFITIPDGYKRVPVSRAGRFHARFGPTIQHNPDGTSNEISGSMTALFNKARTRLSGTWRFKAVMRDATNVVTDTCTTPVIRWHAKQ